MSKNSPHPIKNGPYPSKHNRIHEMFHKEKYLSLEKIIPMEKFTNHYKMGNGLQGWLYHWFLLPAWKNLASRKTLYCWIGLLFTIETYYKRNEPESWLFCWFLSPSFDDHECAYACVMSSFGWKWNEGRFESNRFMQKT